MIKLPVDLSVKATMDAMLAEGFKINKPIPDSECYIVSHEEHDTLVVVTSDNCLIDIKEGQVFNHKYSSSIDAWQQLANDLNNVLVG